LVDQAERIDDIALGFRHLRAVRRAHQAVEIERIPRFLPHVVIAHHHHAGIPEEQDVEAGNEQAVGVVFGEQILPGTGRGTVRKTVVGIHLTVRCLQRVPSVSAARCHLPVSGRIMRPAQRGERPQRAGEPRVEDVGVLNKVDRIIGILASEARDIGIPHPLAGIAPIGCLLKDNLAFHPSGSVFCFEVGDQIGVNGGSGDRHCFFSGCGDDDMVL